MRLKLSVRLGVVSLFLSALASGACASTYTGQITFLQFGPVDSVKARVSIQVAARTVPCGTATTYFSYEGADTGIGKIWTAVLIAAQQSGKTVHIAGTGTCDQYGIETINHIELR